MKTSISALDAKVAAKAEGDVDQQRDRENLDRLVAALPSSLVTPADPGIPILRALSLDKNLIDLGCITDIGVSVSHPGSASCHYCGDCTDECRDTGLYISYQAPARTETAWVDVDYPELIPALIDSLRQEIESGADAVIYPNKMAVAMVAEQGLQRSSTRNRRPGSRTVTRSGG